MPRTSWVPLVLLLAYGVAFGARALGVEALAFDDHPGQLARLIHVIQQGPAPWAWHAGWWAGYPELQFYPPGWFYAGAVISWLTLGLLAPATIYPALVWITWLAPGVTAFVYLVRVLGDGWRALPGAFLVLAFAGDPGGGGASGVEGGVHIGMVAARLAWALLPLLAATLVRWSTDAGRVPLAASALLAAIVLTHPAHVPAALAILMAAALAAPAPRRALGRAAIAAGLALLFTAFWLVPLLWRIEHTRALAWGALGPAALASPFGALLIALVLVAIARRKATATIHALGLGVLAVAVDALVLEPLGLRFLPADRVADGAWMLLLLVAGLGAGVTVGWLRFAPVAALAVVALLIAFAWPARALAPWPRAADWPSLPAVTRGLRLDQLWRTVEAAPPGRVLFIRSGVPLVYGTEWHRPHTHVTALTPAMTGREILGGTFTHGAPVAALVYRGDASRAPIARLAEQLDGVSLLGRPLATLEPAALDAFVRRFRVSVVVAMEDDAPQLDPLGDPARFRRAAVPPFLVFTVMDPAPAPRRLSSSQWETTVDGSDWASTGLAYYPLWRAGYPVRRGAAGDLEVRTGATGATTVRLAYGPGAVELLALGISLAGVAGVLAAAWRRRRTARRA